MQAGTCNDGIKITEKWSKSRFTKLQIFGHLNRII